MINVYYGRSDVDRGRFMFRKTAQYLAEGKDGAVIIVPDQYTLETEKKAFAALNTEGLMDIEIMSFSRLASKLVDEKSYGKKYLDDLGRNMLIKRVVSENMDRLTVFRRIAGKKDFIQMMGDMIQEFKQFNTSWEDIAEISAKNLERFPDKMLMKKLADGAVIYEAYEKALKDKYFDTEDYLNQLCENIRDSEMFEGKVVWITGFEFFSKRLQAVIRELCCKADEVSVDLLYTEAGNPDYNLFAPVEATIGELRRIGEETGQEIRITPIFKYFCDGGGEFDSEYTYKSKADVETCANVDGNNTQIPNYSDKDEGNNTQKTYFCKDVSEEIGYLRNNLYAFPPEQYEGEPKNVKLFVCENVYAEADRIAEEIRRLTLEEGYRFKDIAVVTNDSVLKNDVLKRVFRSQGIAFFDDGLISAIHNRYMQIVIALCSMDKPYSSNAVIFNMLRAGLKGISDDEVDVLENYVLKYGVVGNMWRKPFYKLDDSDREDYSKALEVNCGEVGTDSGSDLDGARGVVGEPERLAGAGAGAGVGTDVEAGAGVDAESERLIGAGVEAGIVVGTEAGEDSGSGMSVPVDEAEIGEAELAYVNEIREKVTLIIDGLHDALEGCATGSEYGEAFFAFLQNFLGLDSDIEAEAERLKSDGMVEYGALTAQLWNRLTDIISQLTQVMGDFECSMKEFFEVLRSGIETLKVGLIPSTIDQVLVGDFARTRSDGVRALFAAGFNDGKVPLIGGMSGILTDNEKDKLNEIAGEVCTAGSRGAEKEKLGIYQAFSMAKEKIYISYVCNGEDGEEVRPSQLLMRIKRIFPKLEGEQVQDDSINSNGDLVYRSRIEYLMKHPERGDELSYIKAGRELSNEREFLSQEIYKALIGDNPVLSPSSLEAYSRCPFAYFMRYVIKADDRKVFEVAAPEMGTIFHEALMRFSEKMSRDKLWSLADEERCRAVIGEFTDEVVREFKRGQLFEGPVGEYRISRIKNVCTKTALMVANHINRGRFDEFYYETAFGKNRDIPPVEIRLGDGREIRIEGRIDRIDVAHNEGEAFVKIIDYKSGSDKVVKSEILSGYRLQLLLYMLAAIGGMEKKYEKVQPAGVFYFKIHEPSINADGKDVSDVDGFGSFLEKNFKKEYKMDGIVVNDSAIIEAFDEEMSGYSDIIRVRMLKSGQAKGTGDFAALTREEFGELLEVTKDNLQSLCESFGKGEVSVSPMRIDENAHACKYCRFKSICGFDSAIPGCSYR